MTSNLVRRLWIERRRITMSQIQQRHTSTKDIFKIMVDKSIMVGNLEKERLQVMFEQWSWT